MRSELGIRLAILASLAAVNAGNAQGLCGASGPDLVVSHIEGIQNYLPSAGIDGVVFATRQTNVGTVPLVANLQTAQHPVQAPNLYRHSVVGGVSRFEQIGMGWCFHAGIPLNMGGFCTCQGGSSSTIGPGCSDPHSAGAMATVQNLGPRWGVDAATGVLVHPHTTPSGILPGVVHFDAASVDPASNPGASFFAELIVLHADEGGDNRGNNATWRPLTATFANGNATFALAGAVHAGEAALQAWKSLVPGVAEAVLDVPGDGRFILAARSVRVAGNQWNYEYAVFNQNSSRGAGSFAVPRPSGAVITAAAFHDGD